MSFCLFAEFMETTGEADAIGSNIPGLQKVHVYSSATAHDPFLNDGAPPPLVIQLYFESLPALELACGGPLQTMKEHCRAQAMLVRPFAVPEPKPAGCTYLVAYEGQAEDENAWHSHYFRHHPPLMARLPGIRELEIYTPVAWVSDSEWKRRHCMQRNKVAFDSAEALTAALNSPVRREMRADYLQLPPFTGRVTHYAMRTRVLSS